MTTKGNTISRVRRLIKAVKQDAFLTDKFLYSVILKYAKLYIKRKDDSNKLGRYNSLYQKFPGVEMEQISRIEAECIDIETCCKFYRSVDAIPLMLEGSMGYLMRNVTSIDGYKKVKQTDPVTYMNIAKSSTFRFNKNAYFWIDGNRKLVMPNVEWPVIDVEAMWEDDITEFLCDGDCCIDRKSERTNVPDDLFAEIENGAKAELLGLLQQPSDNKQDNQSLLK